MTKTIFMLGPDQWDDDFAVEKPLWAHATAGPGFTPKDLRLEAAACIQRESKGAVMGLVMDDKLRRDGEDDAALFSRLEVDHGIDTYFIVLPLQAKVLGTIFEGGMLVRDFKWGANPRIVLFVERGFAEEDADGGYSFIEKGKRTRYLESVIARAHHVEFWDNLEELVDGMTQRAMAEAG